MWHTFGANGVACRASPENDPAACAGKDFWHRLNQSNSPVIFKNQTSNSFVPLVPTSVCTDHDCTQPSALRSRLHSTSGSTRIFKSLQK